MHQQTTRTTREKVIDAATDLILERGFAAVSLKEIELASGVSNGSIFHHFGSKDGIVRELFTAERRAYLGAVGTTIVEYAGDPIAAFGEGARTALRYHTENSERYRRLIVEFNVSNWMRDNAELWIDLAAAIERPVIEWAAPHFATGRLPPLPPPLFQSLMLGPPEALTRQWLAGRLTGKPIDYGDVIADFVTSGLRSELERSRRQGAVDA